MSVPKPNVWLICGAARKHCKRQLAELKSNWNEETNQPRLGW